MNDLKIPNGHQAIMPYLMLDDATRFGDFAVKVLGGTVTSTKLRPESDLIMHSEVEINGSTIMYCSATDEWKPQTANMFIYVTDADETYNKALEEGAQTVMEPSDQSYGRSCGVSDPCGNIWWITSVI